MLVPDVLKRRLFDYVHSGPLAAHLGTDRTLAQLRANYYWPGMAKDVQSWCSSSDVCARSKGAPPRAHAPMAKVTAAAPMDLVAIPILKTLGINVKNEAYKNGYRRRSCTSKTAKIHRFVTFVMYCSITTVPVAFY